MALFIAPAIWFVFGIGALFSLLSLNPVSKLPNLLTIAVALGLTLPNLYGYLKCSKGTFARRHTHARVRLFDYRKRLQIRATSCADLRRTTLATPR